MISSTQLTAQELLAKNIVSGLKSGSIELKSENPELIKRKNGASGKQFVSKKNDKGAYVRVAKVLSLGAKNPRYTIQVVFPGSNKGTIVTSLITGKYARLAWKNLTHVPANRKPKMTVEEVDMAKAAFGF